MTSTWLVEIETTEGIERHTHEADSARESRMDVRAIRGEGFVFTRRVYKVTALGLVGYFTHPFIRTA